VGFWFFFLCGLCGCFMACVRSFGVFMFFFEVGFVVWLCLVFGIFFFFVFGCLCALFCIFLVV